MIKIEDVEVMGMRKAIKGMRNAMNSWDKSDSGFFQCGCPDVGTTWCGEYGHHCHTEDCKTCPMRGYDMGKADMDLAKRLIKAGSPDRKFMRMIHVQADVTAPLYYWKQADQYRIGVTTNSTSTMHTIHKEEFTRANFSYEHIPLGTDNFMINNGTFDFANEPMFFPLNRENNTWLNAEDILDFTIEALNHYRKLYLETKDKKYWNIMIQLLPSSFNQMRTIDLDYETLFNIYHQRKNHKLNEWREFCDWITTLPYMKEFLGLEETNDSREAD